MKKKKIIAVIGTRPEAIKMAPLIKELAARSKMSLISVATAQHRHMLDQVLTLFSIKPDYDLDIMLESQTLAGVASRCISGLEKIISKEKPDIMLVHGDTATTLAAALTGVYCSVKVGHIEAGLRSNDPYNPFPEEYNRVLADALSSWHFAPTEGNRANLLKENIRKEGIFVTGNTGIDAVKQVSARDILPENSAISRLSGRGFVLVTAHRRENFGEPIRRICRGIAELARRHPDIDFVYPVHPNPNIKGPVSSLLSDISNVILESPLSYSDTAWLIKRSLFCITDSGGIQEEAPYFGKPVLLLREVTERPEGVEAGTVKLVGADPELIAGTAGELLTDEGLYRKFSKMHNPYGDGRAAARIADFLEYILGYGGRPSEWKI